MDDNTVLPPLDQRLRTIERLVRPGCVLADIGTDHGYLICHLAAGRRIRHGFACDVNEQPLENARRTIVAAGLGEMVEPLLSDGLAALQDREFDEVVMAGMGGELICGLLEKARWCWRSGIHFILQPMTRAEVLRRFLCINGFEIERELAAETGGFCYAILSVYYTSKESCCSELFAHFGKLTQNADAQSLCYLRWQRKRIADKEKGLSHSLRETELLTQTRQLLSEMDEILQQKQCEVPDGKNRVEMSF